MPKNIHFAFLAFFLLFSGQLAAQTVQESVNAVTGPSNAVFVAVRDSLTLAPIAGAAVTLSNQRISVTSETGVSGISIFENHFGTKDSLLLEVHLLGYNDVSKRLLLHSLPSELTVMMTEANDTLAALVFRDNGLLIVSKGDTVVYNATLLNPRVGDSLRELLNNLPGVSVEGNNVLAGGRQVSRILVNGNVLFGGSLEPALKLIYGTEVKEVRMYDEFDRERLVAADTLGEKDRVLDVRTKNPLNNISALELMAKAGIYPDQTYDRSDQGIYALGGNISRYAVDKPRFDAMLRAGRNTTPFAGSSVASSPESEAIGNINYSLHRKNRDQLFLSAEFRTKQTTTGQHRQMEYLTSSPLFGTSFKMDTEKSDMNSQGSCRMTYTHIMGTNATVKIGGTGYYDYGSVSESETTNYLVGELIARSQSISHKTLDLTARGGISAGYTRATANGKLSTSLSIPFSKTGLTGSKVDTMLMSARSLMEAYGWGTAFAPDFGISYRRKINGKLMLNFRSGASYSDSDREYLAQDILTAQVDTINTYRLQESRFAVHGSFSADYGKSSDPFYIMTSISFVHESASVADYFPERIANLHELNRVYPSITAGFNLPGLNGILEYRESGSIPASSLLRSRLDNSSTLFVTSGNPDLKASRIHDLKAELNWISFENALALKLHNRYICETNSIINEYLPLDQGYLLSHPINTGTSHKLSTQLFIDKSILAIKGNVRVLVSNEYSSVPFVMAERHGRNNSNQFGFTLSYNGRSYNWLSYTLEYSPNWQNAINSEYDNSIGDFSQTLRGSTTARLFGHIDFSLSGKYVNNCSDIGMDYHYLSPSAEISYRYGKNLSRSISLTYKDFLNKSVSEHFTVSNEYLSKIYSRIMSRSILLNFSILFR